VLYIPEQRMRAGVIGDVFMARGLFD